MTKTIHISDVLPEFKQYPTPKKEKKKSGFVLDRETLEMLFKYHSGGNYNITKENKKIIDTVFKYFLQEEDFNKHNIITSEASLNKGLLIFGDYGIGKTFLFETLHKVGRDLLQKRNHTNLWFNCISAGSFVEMYMKEVTKKDSNADTNFDLNNYYKGKLYIDDLGFEKMAFNKTELFGEILFERNRANKITYVTTNLKPSEITKRYGERIGDRLVEMFNIIKWNGKSFRK